MQAIANTSHYSIDSGSVMPDGLLLYDYCQSVYDGCIEAGIYKTANNDYIRIYPDGMWDCVRANWEVN
jgi:hypothetical protein